MGAGRGSSRIRAPRLAEQVAAKLRDRIESGELGIGGSLPTQAALLDELGVSRPTLRDALGILEIEGLVTVRRGSRGGATVNRSEPRGITDALAAVLAAQRTPVGEVGRALAALEPTCASMCAARPDRGAAVQLLRSACVRAGQTIDDPQSFAVELRRFHEAIAAECGNATVAPLVGALQRLLPADGIVWAFPSAADPASPSPETRESMLFAHQRIVDLIEAGDVDNATRLGQRHVCVTPAG
jgi:DNA-binding FadR family transcriptional regulator